MAKKANKAEQSGTPSSTQSPVMATLYGEATAIGQNTVADGNLSLGVKDHGPVTIIKGKISATATATSPDDTATYATAESGATVTGADIVRTKTKTSSYTEQDGDTSVWTQTSTTKLFAIDIEGRNFTKVKAQTKVEQKDTKQDLDFDIDGNIADLDASVRVEGEHTYADAQISILTVEDSLSTVSAAITGGLG
jgi:hypothetical protein